MKPTLTQTSAIEFDATKSSRMCPRPSAIKLNGITLTSSLVYSQCVYASMPGNIIQMIQLDILDPYFVAGQTVG